MDPPQVEAMEISSKNYPPIEDEQDKIVDQWVLRRMSDAADARKVLEAVKKNVEMVNKGLVNPKFANVPSLLPDPTNPLTPNAQDIASEITNVVADPTEKGSASSSKLQSSEEVQKLVLTTAAQMGALLTKSHMDDLLLLASTNGPLSDTDVWFYVRGVLRATQVSATTSLEKALAGIEMLSKSTQVILSNNDFLKHVGEELTVISNKIENVAPSICSMVQSDIATISAQLSKDTLPVKPVPTSIASGSTIVTSEIPKVPGPDENGGMP